MKIALAADHGGFELKDRIAEYLDEKGYDVIDYGTNSSDSCDYPDYAKVGCDAVLSGVCDVVLLFCGTGIGISIAANKIRGIRCALCTSPVMSRLAKEHNNANALAMGGRTTDFETAAAIVDAYFEAEFLGGRHQNRINKISALEGVE